MQDHQALQNEIDSKRKELIQAFDTHQGITAEVLVKSSELDLLINRYILKDLAGKKACL